MLAEVPIKGPPPFAQKTAQTNRAVKTQTDFMHRYAVGVSAALGRTIGGILGPAAYARGRASSPPWFDSSTCPHASTNAASHSAIARYFATENLLARLRARQLAIPSKIAAIVAAAGAISEIENITEDAIREGLAELAAAYAPPNRAADAAGAGGADRAANDYSAVTAEGQRMGRSLQIAACNS
jgi:hypothetical protein